TRVSADVVDGIPLLGVRRSQVTGMAVLVKRAFDLFLSLLLLVLLSPILVLLSLGIKLTSPGPVLYRQQRVGMGNTVFTVYKFRSMVSDAEAETGPVFASPDDVRRTSVGRFMRRYSLDELPQLVNIIRG